MIEPSTELNMPSGPISLEMVTGMGAPGLVS
jgi:hypothetical protein